MPDRPAPGGEVEAPRRRILLWVGGLLAAAVLAALVAAFALVNGETAKAAIERRLATLTGTDIRYGTLTLRAWPLPEAELRDVALRIAPDADAVAARVVLQFALLPLLRGEVRVSLVRLEQPMLTVRIPAFDDGPVADLVAAYRGAVGPATEWLAQNAPGVAFEVRDGTVDLAAPGVPSLRLDALVADGDVSSDAIAVTVAAHANRWRNARAQLRIDTHSLAANLELDIEALDAAPALERVLASSSTRILPAASTASLAMTTDGRGLAGAQLSIAMPALGLTRNGSRLDVGASRARLRATWSVPETTLVVEQLQLGDLLPAATGSLKLRSGAGGTVLDATLPRVDVGRALAEALRLVDDGSWVHALAAIVKGGNALDLRVNVAGDDLGVLADPSAYDLSMNVEGASIDVPPLGLQFAAASGTVRIAQRVLNARGVAATIGRSTLRDGNIVLALDPKVVLRELTAALDVDLAANLGLAARLQGETAAPSVFSGIQSITGRARGTLTLRETNGGYHQTYDVTSLAGTMRHAAVPLPIAVDGGGLRYESGGALTLRGLAGTIGASRIERIDAVLALGPDPVVRSAAGNAVLALDELFPWLTRLRAARALRDDISALQGTIGVDLTRLVGPLRAPERLDVAAVLTPQQVRIRSPHLPAVLTISTGSIRVEGPNADFQGVRIAMQDARSTLSGSLHAYASPTRAFDVSITQARIGPRILEWAEDELGLAPGARAQAPVALERARLRWPASAPWRLDVDAAATFPSGTHADVGFVWMPGRMQIRRLAVKDPDSDLVATLDWETGRAGVTFRGFLSAKSIGRMLVAPPAASGVLRGDFEAALDLRDPVRSKVSGKLAGADVALPVAFGAPLLIERIALDADGSRVSVRDTVLRFAGEPVTVAGSVARVGDGFDVDADIEVDGIDAERHLRAVAHGRGEHNDGLAVGMAAARADRRARGTRRRPRLPRGAVRRHRDARRAQGDGRRHHGAALRAGGAAHVDRSAGHPRGEGSRDRGGPAGRWSGHVPHQGHGARVGHPGLQCGLHGQRSAGRAARQPAGQRAVARP